MSTLIDDIDFMDDTSNKSQSKFNINLQNLSHYLQSFTGISEPIKVFHLKGEKLQIVLEIPLVKQLPQILIKIQIDKRRKSYQSKFVLKNQGDILQCQTKCLRLMLMKQFEYLKKKFKLYSYSMIARLQTGDITGRNYLTVSPNTNIYQLLMFQLLPLRNILTKILTISLYVVNLFPPLYEQFIQEKYKNFNQIIIQDRIQKRIYKYFYYSILEMWKNYSESPTESLQNQIDKRLQERLENEFFYQFFQESSEFYVHRLKIRNSIKFQITDGENSNIKIHLKPPPVPQIKRSQSNFIFNQIHVLQEIGDFLDVNKRGGSNKILICTLKFIYLNNAILNHSQSHNNKKINNKEYIKVLGIKVPLQSIRKQKGQKKNQHEIKILKLLRDTQSPFLLKYFVCPKPNFKYSNILMMNYASNAETLNTFLSKKQLYLSFTSKLFILVNILQGLKLLSQYDIVHMDLSPGNVLINPNLMIQLIDFGESYHQKVCGSDYNSGFTLPFTFPQKFSHKKFTSKSDIFSFGILVFYTIFNKILPFHPSGKLLESMKDFSYINRHYFAPEIVDYYGNHKLLTFIVSYIYKCIDPDLLIRPHPSWSIVLFKELYFWLEEISTTIAQK